MTNLVSKFEKGSLQLFGALSGVFDQDPMACYKVGHPKLVGIPGNYMLVNVFDACTRNSTHIIPNIKGLGVIDECKRIERKANNTVLFHAFFRAIFTNIQQMTCRKNKQVTGVEWIKIDAYNKVLASVNSKVDYIRILIANTTKNTAIWMPLAKIRHFFKIEKIRRAILLDHAQYATAMHSRSQGNAA